MDDIYREYILDLYRNPLNKRELQNYTHKSHGHNPSCGDDIWVYIHVVDDRVEDMSFEGKACALCIAGASMTTEKLKGLSTAEITTISAEQLYQWLGITMENTRIKCVTLALRTTQEMIV
jgi:nitrogen fixation NifU-like protein